MKKIFLILSIFCCLGIQAKDYHYTTVAGDPMGVRIYTLDNGLKVYLSVNKEQPRITAHIAVSTGSKNDPAETTGLAHYLEHLMFKGTQQYGTTSYAAEKPYLDEIEARYEEYRTITDPELRRQKYHEIDSVSQIAAKWFIPNEYDKLMSQIGANGTNAYTSYDETVYVEDIPSNEIDNWAKIQSDRFKNMVIRGFHTELEAVYEEFNIGLAQDQRKIFDTIMANLFPTHPYGLQNTIGTQDHLKNPSITNIKNYFNTYYCPNNVAICMAGDLDPEATMAIIDKYFGDWKTNASLKKPVHAPVAEITKHKEATVTGLEAESVWIAWKADKGASLQSDTLQVMDYLLTNGKAGLVDLDLNNEMRVLTAGTGTEMLADYSIYLAYGMPNEGQTLEEVRDLLLGEIEKVKRGEFSEELMTAVTNNKKLSEMVSLEQNEARVSKMVNAFIQGKEWSQVASDIERQAKITKEDIVAFANSFFKDNYVVVYKRQGNDDSQKKIEKPAITPIPTNRDYVSQFVTDVQNAQVEPIQPQFVDFQRDITFAKTKNKQELLYKKNTENSRFSLSFVYDFGTQADNRYSVAANYLDLLGTNRLSSSEVKAQFYNLACDMSVYVGARETTISLSGLNDNLVPALQLLNEVVSNAKADKEVWDMYVDQILKSRQDAKADQKSNFSALRSYANYGDYNPQKNIMSEAQLRSANPQEMVDLISGMKNLGYTLLYYGPSECADVCKLVAKNFPTAKKPQAVPENKEYMFQPTPQNEVIIAPYDAKNIYMTMAHSQNLEWTPERAPIISLFNEYYGGGMNTVVFQEMREARGLAYAAAAYYISPSTKTQRENWFTYIITQNDKMPDCVTHFNEIIDNMPVSEGAFNIAKDALLKRLASERTTKAAVFSAYLKAKELGLDYDIDKKVYETVPSLTLQDVVNFEKATMANKTLRYVILGDEKELDMPFLEKIGTIKRVSTEEIF